MNPNQCAAACWKWVYIDPKNASTRQWKQVQCGNNRALADHDLCAQHMNRERWGQPVERLSETRKA